MPGGREETVDDSEILRLFEEGQDPFLFTGEVADMIGFSNQGALPRLKKLEERGLLDSKRGGKVLAWWITEEGKTSSNPPSNCSEYIFLVQFAFDAIDDGVHPVGEFIHGTERSVLVGALDLDAAEGVELEVETEPAGRAGSHLSDVMIVVVSADLDVDVRRRLGTVEAVIDEIAVKLFGASTAVMAFRRHTCHE